MFTRVFVIVIFILYNTEVTIIHNTCTIISKKKKMFFIQFSTRNEKYSQDIYLLLLIY